MNLGLRNSILEVIRSKEQGDIYDSLRGVIVEWLKMNYNTAKFGQPTWRRIVEAVRATTGGRNPALADRLARKYNCGKKFMLIVAENQAPFILALIHTEVIQDTQPVASQAPPSRANTLQPPPEV